jgi:hypothetical protein
VLIAVVLCLRGKQRFAQRRDSVEDEHTGHPRSVKTELQIPEVAMFVHASYSQILHGVAAWISHGTCPRILYDDLNMPHTTQHSVPRILSRDQRDDCMSTCTDLIDSAYKDGMFHNQVITEDKTQSFPYNSQLKQQSATRKSQ